MAFTGDHDRVADLVIARLKTDQRVLALAEPAEGRRHVVARHDQNRAGALPGLTQPIERVLHGARRGGEIADRIVEPDVACIELCQRRENDPAIARAG